MIKIRQLMTEVLLEVTTEEIREAAVEAMLFFKGKSYSRVYFSLFPLFLLLDPCKLFAYGQLHSNFECNFW
jgi:hypothetical protein